MPGTQKARRPPTCCTRATGVRLCGRARVRLARLVSDCPDHTLPAPALNLFTSFIQTSGRGRVKRPEVPAAISSSLMQVCSRAMAESGESSVSEVRQSLKELRKLRELRKLCFDHPGPVTGAHFAVDVLGGDGRAFRRRRPRGRSVCASRLRRQARGTQQTQAGVRSGRQPAAGAPALRWRKGQGAHAHCLYPQLPCWLFQRRIGCAHEATGLAGVVGPVQSQC